MDEKTKKRFSIPKPETKGKYVTNINSICKECGFKNVGKYQLEEEMPVVCCGKCGAFILTPDNMSDDDKQSIQLCVQQALEDTEEEN